MESLDPQIQKEMNDRYVGRRVICVEMKDPYNPVPSGTQGTVQHIDSYPMRTDIGSLRKK